MRRRYKFFKERSTPSLPDFPRIQNEEDGMKSPCAVNVHNAVTVSQQRRGKHVAHA